jgi:hypothetical protein
MSEFRGLNRFIPHPQKISAPIHRRYIDGRINAVRIDKAIDPFLGKSRMHSLHASKSRLPTNRLARQR